MGMGLQLPETEQRVGWYKGTLLVDLVCMLTVLLSIFCLPSLLGPYIAPQG